MKDRYPNISLARFCWLLGITRQAYYQHGWRERVQGIEDELVLQQVLNIRTRHRRMGGRKLFELLEPFMLEHQIKMGRDALFDLLASNHLLVRRKRRSVRTTQSHHWLHKHPNLLAGLVPEGPNELWASDITYLRTPKGFLYISLITDVFSHKVVGHHIAESLESLETIQALQMALNQYRRSEKQLVHHSDRGVQYCSADYVKLLQENSIGISMTQSGDPLENAVAERINGIIKGEYMDLCQITNLAQGKQHLEDTVTLYNNERPHMSIGMLTPERVHTNSLITENLWKRKHQKLPPPPIAPDPKKGSLHEGQDNFLNFGSTE
jgi:putative transposase